MAALSRERASERTKPVRCRESVYERKRGAEGEDDDEQRNATPEPRGETAVLVLESRRHFQPAENPHSRAFAYSRFRCCSFVSLLPRSRTSLSRSRTQHTMSTAEPQSHNTLYIGNLDGNVTENDLYSFFGSCGEIDALKLAGCVSLSLSLSRAMMHFAGLF